MKRLASVLLTLSILLLFSACDSEILFSYKKLIDNEFNPGKKRANVGNVIPITIEKAIEIDGDLSRNGLHFYYSSNRESGNYDIYLRSLTDITTVRVTNHPSRDSSPAVSPDGKYLAFVSNREDPEGDIYVVRINADRLITRTRASVKRPSSLDSEAVNITQFQDPVTRTIRIIRDSSPAWSPDGKLIAFTSKRGNGKENIWLMNRKGKSMKQLTTEGGLYPCFSPDGKSIVFISYRDRGSSGEVYTIDLKTMAETRVTDSAAIKLYPAFMRNREEIIYTEIARDTNRNRRVDLNDRGVIIYRNTETGMTYPLTLLSRSSFASRWFPLFSTESYSGVIVFADQVGENINLNIIPETGIIPARADAAAQHYLATRYMTEYGDSERYFMALERVYQFHGHKKDPLSRVFTARSLAEAAIEYRKAGNTQKYREMTALLKDRARGEDPYTDALYRAFLKKLKGKTGLEDIRKSRDESLASGKNKEYLPFFTEDLARLYTRAGKSEQAASLYLYIIDNHPGFHDIIGIHREYSLLTDRKMGDRLSPSAFAVLGVEAGDNKRIEITGHLLKIFSGEKNREKRLGLLNDMLRFYKKKDDRKITELLYYAIGKTYHEMGDIENAKKYLVLSTKHASKGYLIYYKSHNLLGDISFEEKKMKTTEKYYSQATKYYRYVWHEPDFREKVQYLITYFEDYGERYESAGRYDSAVALYKKYKSLMRHLHRRKRFDDLTNKYGPRSYVLWVDAYFQLEGWNKIQKLEKIFKKDLVRARMDFDKALIYGFGYYYAKRALMNESMGGQVKDFKAAMEHIDWAIFLDDSFTEPLVLKSWIYQYLELKRGQGQGWNNRVISKQFPKYLWENNIPMLEKALNANDETVNPENEGNIHLNLANNYSLLTNYPRSLHHYIMAAKFKKGFGSRIEEALFYFHMAYSYWQNGELEMAREQINRSLGVYRSFITKKNIGQYKEQVYLLYKYYALFYRWEGKYREAVNWYGKILSFARKQGVTIDRARYLQEIGYCYREMGDLDTATAYLKRAKRELKDYPDDEKKFKMRFTLLGVLPFSFYNLGPDTAVIGDNKIFSSLDTRNKKMLNRAIREEIYFENRNFRKAIKYLKRKIDLVKERDYQVDRENMSTSLNNLGFYYFKVRDYKNAMSSFKKAWKYSSDPDVNNLEGTFQAIMNLSNLYAYLLDHRPGELKKPLEEISTTIEKIDRYRTRYEQDRYAAELEILKESASARKREVREDELERLRENIKKEAVDIYYTIDIAIGVLNYYKAGLLSMGQTLSGKEGLDGAWQYYGLNRDIYDLYTDSLRRFDNALDTAEKNNSRELMVKLHMNAASCYTGIGDLRSAYAAYLDAEKLAEENRFHSLRLSLYDEISSFLVLHGKEVEGKDSLEIAAGYCKMAAKLVEDIPSLYSDEIDRVRNLYDRYATLLVRAGDYRAALLVSEKKYSVLRTMLVVSASPEFRSERDRDLFLSYLERVRDIDSLMKSVSKTLVTGAEADSAEVKALGRDLERAKDSLTSLINSMGKEAPSLYGLLAPPTGKLPSTGTAVYRFFDLEGTLCSWKAEKGKVSFTRHKTTDIGAALSQVLSGNTGPAPYVILNSILAGYLDSADSTRIKNALPPFMLALSMYHADVYRSQPYAGLHTVHFTGDDADRSTDADDDAEESACPEFIGHSILVDESGAHRIDHNVLFSAQFRPSAIIKSTEDYSLDSILLFAEAARYAGIATVVFTKAEDRASMEKIIFTAREKGFSRAQAGIGSGLSALSIGYEGIPAIAGEAISSGTVEKQLSLFLEHLNSGEYVEARIILERWHNTARAQGNKDALSQYYFYRARLCLLNNDISSAVSHADLALGAAPEGSRLHDRAEAMKIYILLRSGDVKTAKGILAVPEENNSSIDYKIFRAIVKLADQGFPSVETLFNEDEDARELLLDRADLIVLYADYLRGAGMRTQAREFLRNIDERAALSDRDALMVFHETGTGTPRLSMTKRSRAIQKLAGFSGTASDLRSSASLLVAQGDRYDGRSPFPVFMAMDYFRKYHLLDEMAGFFDASEPERLVKASDWSDVTMLLSERERVLTLIDDHKGALKTSIALINMLDDKGITGIARQYRLRAALSRLRLGRYADALDTVRSGMQGLTESDPLYLPFLHLLIDCEVHTGRDAEALARISRARDRSRALPEHMLTYALLESKTELNRLMKLKKIKSTKTARVEKLFSGALEIIENDPSVLHRSGMAGLADEIADGILRLKVRTGRYHDALSWAELKKHLGMLAKLPGLRMRPSSPDLRVMTRSLPSDSIRKRIPGNAMLVCLVRSGDDILAWIAGRDYEKIKVLPGINPKLIKAASGYRERAARYEGTMDISRKLNSLLEPIRKYYWTKKKYLIFCLDRDLESVPIEILGKKNMLAEKHVTLFLSTLFPPAGTAAQGRGAIHILGQGATTATHIERIAIQENGLKYSGKGEVEEGSVLLHLPVSFSRLSDRLYLGEREYQSVLKGADCLYVPHFLPDNLGYTDFSLYNAYRGTGCVVINSSVIQDINNAYFTGTFFRELAGSGDFYRAYEKGRYEIWKRKDFRHPAYWAGIRLYLYGL